MKRRITTKVLRSGQPRPYADSQDEIHFTFEMERYGHPDEWEPMFCNEDDLGVVQKVTKIVKVLADCTDTPKHGFERILSTLSMISPGVWKVVVDQAYTG